MKPRLVFPTYEALVRYEAAVVQRESALRLAKAEAMQQAALVVRRHVRTKVGLGAIAGELEMTARDIQRGER